ncbi:MAG: hypothetical protein M3270_03995 [Thermoproteota archaeon]|nr:hypothetical protein [Thermoproteota archaeon]
MVEKMTAVWLIILTILVCAAVPGALIWLTSSAAPAKAPAKMITWAELLANSPNPDQFQ